MKLSFTLTVDVSDDSKIPDVIDGLRDVIEFEFSPADYELIPTPALTNFPPSR